MLELLGLLEFKVVLDNQVLLVILDNQDLKEMQDNQETKVFLEPKEFKVKQVLQARRVNLVQWVNQDPSVIPVLAAVQDPRVHQDLKVRKVKPDRMEILVPQEQKASKDLRGPLDHWVNKVQLEPKEYLVLPVKEARKDLLEPRE